MLYLRLIIGALTTLAVLAAGGAVALAEAPPRVIAQAQADLDGDGRAETLEVLLLQGERRNDAEQ